MKPMTRTRPVFLLLLGVLLSACTGPRFNPRAPEASTTPVADVQFSALPAIERIQPEWLVPPREQFRLGVGDKVEIEILEVAGTRQDCTVMPDGLIYFNLLPGLRAEGLTLAELRDLLQIRLRADYRTPQVGVILRGVTSRRVWVMGRVNTPGLFPLDQPMTILEAIAKAGGLFTSRYSGTTEELADLRHSFFVRDGRFVPVDFHRLLREGDMSQNLYLRDGDYIYLPSALSKQVFVLGAVNSPRAIGYMDRVTLISAIASARDLARNAQAERVLVIRGSLSAPHVAAVNYQDVLRGLAPDVVLQPGDIVWVPDSPIRNLLDYARVVVSTFVRTVAANEGVRAAVPGAQPVGVNINVGGTSK